MSRPRIPIRSMPSDRGVWVDFAISMVCFGGAVVLAVWWWL